MNPQKTRVTVKKLDEALKERGAPYSLIGSKAEKEKVLKDFHERDENHPNNVEFDIGDLEEVLAEKRTIFDGYKLHWISIENLKKKDIPKDFKRRTITKFLRDSPLVAIEGETVDVGTEKPKVKGWELYMSRKILASRFLITQDLLLVDCVMDSSMENEKRYLLFRF